LFVPTQGKEHGFALKKNGKRADSCTWVVTVSFRAFSVSHQMKQETAIHEGVVLGMKIEYLSVDSRKR
jgi:hypothetical protein